MHMFPSADEVSTSQKSELDGALLSPQTPSTSAGTLGMFEVQ